MWSDCGRVKLWSEEDIPRSQRYVKSVRGDLWRVNEALHLLAPNRRSEGKGEGGDEGGGTHLTFGVTKLVSMCSFFSKFPNYLRFCSGLFPSTET